jgi:hypothetical protein
LPPDGANVAVVAPAALAAARETLARVEALNAVETTGNPPLSLNIALHAGETASTASHTTGYRIDRGSVSGAGMILQSDSR